MRVKILDAWARGLPVVSTTIGAEGLHYRSGEDILIADTPEDFAAAVNAVLADAGLAHRLAAAGRATVEQRYDLGHKYVFRYDRGSTRYIELFDLGR
jgi:glycosyltransferase involved in cell wall biosynthesis